MMAEKPTDPSQHLDAAFSKIFLKFASSQDGERVLDKLQFKCAFVFAFGVKPSKQDK